MLLSRWFLLSLIALTAAAAGGLVWLEVCRHRRVRDRTLGRPRAWLARLLSVALVLCLAAVCVADELNRQFSYFPTFAALFGNPSPDLVHVRLAEAAPAGRRASKEGHGVDVREVIAGPLSGIRRPGYVYLSPQYFDPAWAKRRFPVLYYIHGSPGVAIDTIRGVQIDRAMDHLLADHRVQPFIVVMPDANGGYRRDLECQDVLGGPKDQTYLAKDVVQWTDANLRTIPDRWHRALGGYSTGGFCSLNLAFRHQGVFSAAVSNSGGGEPDHGRYTGELFGGRRDLRLANSPVHYLRQIPIPQPMAAYLDCGLNDHWSFPKSVRLDTILRQRGVATTFHRVAGAGHTFTLWRKNIARSLAWLSDWFTTRQAPMVSDSISVGSTADRLPAHHPPRRPPQRHTAHQVARRHDPRHPPAASTPSNRRHPRPRRSS
ncbi:MAG: esterase [Acidimicrobiales bacterium]|nr:esterase [Acidimicrobiales bacterium]